MISQKRTPVVSLILIAANIGAAFVLTLQPELVQRFGFVPAQPDVLAALTCLFLHANLVHLLGNMIFLAAAGPAAEAAVGPVRFFGSYLACGLLGVAAHWALSANPGEPLIGASGAVAGCAALAAVRFYRVRVPLAPKVSVSVLAVVGLWIVLQGVGALVKIGDQAAGVSYWAHLGGAAAGLLLALAFRTQKAADFELSKSAVGELSGRSPAAHLAATEQHLKDHPDDLTAKLDRADALVALGEMANARKAFHEAFEAATDSQQVAVTARAVKANCCEAIPVARRTLLAERLRFQEDQVCAGKLLESVVMDASSNDQRPEAILALAELRRDEDPQSAQQLIDELFRSYPLHPAADVARARGLAR